MQNYAYNRNAMQNSENLRYRSSYVRRPRSSASYTILRALVRIFLSDTAILTYKITALLFTVAIVLGTVGAAENGMLYHAQALIASAEQTFKSYDAVVKQQGGSAGALKKDNVMTKLQAYAMQNGYAFDAEFWSQKVDAIVAMTKEVNAKQ